MKTWMLVGAFGALAGCVDDVQVAKREDAGTPDRGIVDAGDARGGIDVPDVPVAPDVLREPDVVRVLDVPDVPTTPDVRVTTDATTDRVNTDNGGCDGSGFCNADFPCGGTRFSCTNNVRWYRMVTRDCSFRCGCVPCGGASCEFDGTEQRCPEGTMCTVPVGAGDDLRETPCGPPTSTEDVAVRTARVRSLLAGSWSVGRFGPNPESARFVIDLRSDGSLATRCYAEDATCSPFGFSVTGDGGGRAWNLEEVSNVLLGRATLRLPDAGGTLRTVVLEEMQFTPSTESITVFFVRVTPADGGATDTYQFGRRP